MRYLKLLVLGLFLLPVYGHSQVSVVQLKTEDKINPIGMGEINPDLVGKFSPELRG